MPLSKILLSKIANEDLNALVQAELSYGESWCRRGGVDSFMMLARKMDRIEHQVRTQHGYNILEACVQDTRPEGIIDDIRDLRRYLFLVEEKIRREHGIHNNQLTKNIETSSIDEDNGDVEEPAGYIDQG